MRRVLILVLSLTISACALSQELIVPDVFLTGDRALAIHDPILIMGQKLSGIAISDDGRYVVLIRETASSQPRVFGQPEPKAERLDLVIWDSQTGTSREISLPKETTKRRMSLSWLKNTHSCVLEIDSDLPVDLNKTWRTMNSKKEFFMIDPARGRLRKFYQSDPSLSSAYLNFSPTVSRAILTEITHDDTAEISRVTQYKILLPNGTWEKETTMPDGMWRSGISTWSEDGRTLLIEVEKFDKSQGRSVPRVAQYHLTTGDFDDIAGPVKGYEFRQAQKDILLERRPVTSTTYGTAPTGTQQWWITSTQDADSKPVLITEHAEFAVLSTNDEYVLYSFKRSLYVRRIQELTRQEYELFLENEVRTKTMIQAKQVALGLIMYAVDYDDEISSGLNFPSDIEPYLRNDQLTDGFTYTFAGGKLSDFSNPAKTELGYITTPYGKAIAYLDGHIEWETKN